MAIRADMHCHSMTYFYLGCRELSALSLPREKLTALFFEAALSNPQRKCREACASVLSVSL